LFKYLSNELSCYRKLKYFDKYFNNILKLNKTVIDQLMLDSRDIKHLRMEFCGEKINSRIL